MLQAVFKHTLFGGDPRTRVEVLHAATAAYAEVRAHRRDTHRAWLDDALYHGFFERWFAACDPRFDDFTRQSALNKHRFAVITSDALAFVVNGFNGERDGHGGKRC